ncbi:amidase [Paeniglutamicibacter kerguelensis]|uniref:Aspartyl-tRNA(Asn)/glutamyl-tRNA(Gln) amidotransferase subunit A n=1 Tax=Paeniglutamicibacter kerguelensis TaxID=254788 RepID=A0ABS4XK67_9MICC|nr:amidase [Paeniglutamicibacter kerguelensis]MBP2388847.1 aspartyl-tRNA(Asn)/glutamyl-tRNA(Gln) amidotransferase subunit A [Paeniglutamicibacter kerguelensis]
MTAAVETAGLHQLTLAQAGELIGSHRLSPVEYVEALVARAEAVDVQVQAYVTRTFEQALDGARKASDEIAAGRYRGPLHGIPFALKDCFNTAGIPTTGHSRVLADNVPDRDAVVTGKLRDAGALLMGKLALFEFAHGGPSFDLPWPPPRNPWNLTRVTGGSSSGSAAAIAAGMVPASIGTDTGGSIRVPASRCGITGLMPTPGLVGRSGVIPHSHTFDRSGPMARTAEDCAILLQSIAGHDPADPASVAREIPDYVGALTGDLRGLRIGVLRHNWEEEVSVSKDECRAMDAALGVLEELGATLEDCRIRPMQSYGDIKTIIAETEVLNVHQRELIARPDHFGDDILGRMLPAVLFTANDLIRAGREHQRAIAEMQPLYRRFDAFITICSGEAPTFSAHDPLAFWKNSNHFTAANVTGQPVLALPNGFGSGGLPLGMQILGRPFGEATILRIGHAYQMATGWHLRHPELVAGAIAPPVEVPRLSTGTLGDVDPVLRGECLAAVGRAGLDLDGRMLEQLLEGAPYALAMADRMPRDHAYAEAPANVFSLRSP